MFVCAYFQNAAASSRAQQEKNDVQPGFLPTRSGDRGARISSGEM